MSNALLEAALDYARRGWPVLPLHGPASGSCSCSRPDCSSPAKHPRTRNGLKDASTDEDAIRVWWERWPTANVGILTGIAFDVLDIDGDEGLAAFLALADEHGGISDAWPRTITGGGGRHVLVAPTGSGNRARLLDHVDWRGRDGYIVAPPSRHVSGNHYAWKVEPNGHVPPAPSWLLELLNSSQDASDPGRLRTSRRITATDPAEAYRRRALADELAELAGAAIGERNDRLNRSAFALYQLVAGGELDEGEVTQQLTTVARGLGLGDVEIRATLRSAQQKAQPRSRPITPDHAGQGASRIRSESRTVRADLDNARRFVQEHGARVRWAAGQWYLWDGLRWAEVDSKVVRGLAPSTVDGMLAEALDADDMQALKWAVTCRGLARIEAMVNLACSEPGIGIRVDDLDADRSLLTCLDGTIDLRTGEIREHRPEDLITKQAPVRFRDAVGDDEWSAFLAQVLPDEETRRWLQLLVGSALLGRNAEERLPFLTGPAATGKTTALEAIRTTLGDYAGVIPFRALLDTVAGGARPDIAGLRGVRFVVASEVGDGERWDAGLVKALTGGEAISARRLYRDPITFVPTFTVFTAANTTPRVNSEDDGMWRRLAVVRFDQVVERRDPSVKARLTDPAICGGAVLRWAVAGSLAYQRAGLGEDPGTVRRATEDYRRSQDRISGFLDEAFMVTRDRADHVESSHLYAGYQTWCSDQGERFPLTQTALGKLLKARGCEPGHNPGKTARWWFGIRWREPGDPDNASAPCEVPNSFRTGRTGWTPVHTFRVRRADEKKLSTYPSDASNASGYLEGW